jgi:CheY-like chemotaxis protein
MTSCSTILVIEDDEPIRDAICYAIESAGYNVISAGDGKAGLEMLEHAKKPCLILLDLMLPIMNGWEFFEIIRSDPRNALATIPVVITSAAGAGAVTAAQKADGYIKKPIDIDRLYEVVGKFCKAA